MSTDIDSLPDSQIVSMPPELERELDNVYTSQTQEPEYKQPNMQPHVGNVQARVKPVDVEYISQQASQQASQGQDIDLGAIFLSKLLSKDFAVLLVLLLVADSRFINFNIIRHIPMAFVRNNALVQTLFKVLFIGLVFLLIKTFV